MNEKIEANLVENKIIVWDAKKGSELYKLGYYGKPLGISKPKTPDFNVPLILDLFEGLYLKEKGLITIYEDDKELNKRELVKKAKKAYKDFLLKYLVYKDLRDRNLVVQSGIKFGCDFAVYEHGPGIDHAPYLIQVKREVEKLDATDIVRAGRLATTVRKRFIIAVPQPKMGKVEYLMFKWWRA
ncbi:MAG: tRNA-intron lyase [Candidatus Bathyarchaeota archaeon]|nr:tRNA-intron lyase [Candidatus Bathyarchaeota archaeon]